MIEIPTVATVLMLGGLWDNTNHAKSLRGELAGKGHTVVAIDYPQAAQVNSIKMGKEILDARIRVTAGPKIVYGHSQGAEVISEWLEEFAEDPTAPDPDELMFVVTGNPRRNPGGRGIGGRTWDGRRVFGTPNTRYRLIDVARRYDGWAIKSWSLRSLLGMFFVHSNYKDVGINDPKNGVHEVATNTLHIVSD